MSLPQSQIRHTVEEYLAFEREAEVRHEYLDGQVYAMAGESLEHSRICVNLAREISAQLKGRPCEALSPNMKVRTSQAGLFAYPDLSVVCSKATFHDSRRDVLVNPQIVIEVLSPSTEAYDRGGKFLRYQQIETLTVYLLVAQDRPLIEHYVRQPGRRWLYSVVGEISGGAEVASIDVHLHLAEVYDRVSFPPQGELLPVAER